MAKKRTIGTEQPEIKPKAEATSRTIPEVGQKANHYASLLEEVIDQLLESLSEEDKINTKIVDQVRKTGNSVIRQAQELAKKDGITGVALFKDENIAPYISRALKQVAPQYNIPAATKDKITKRVNKKISGIPEVAVAPATPEVPVSKPKRTKKIPEVAVAPATPEVPVSKPKRVRSKVVPPEVAVEQATLEVPGIPDQPESEPKKPKRVRAKVVPPEVAVEPDIPEIVESENIPQFILGTPPSTKPPVVKSTQPAPPKAPSVPTPPKPAKPPKKQREVGQKKDGSGPRKTPELIPIEVDEEGWADLPDTIIPTVEMGIQHSSVYKSHPGQAASTNEVALRERKFLYNTEWQVEGFKMVNSDPEARYKYVRKRQAEVGERVSSKRGKIEDLDEIKEPQTVPAVKENIPVQEALRDFYESYAGSQKDSSKQPVLQVAHTGVSPTFQTPQSNPLVAEAARVGRTGILESNPADFQGLRDIYNKATQEPNEWTINNEENIPPHSPVGYSRPPGRK